MKIGDYINGQIQKIIRDLTPEEMREKADRWLTLYIFQEKGEKWIALCDEPRDESERILERVNEKKGEKWEALFKTYGEGVLYSQIQKDVADYRLESDGDCKTLLWMIYVKEKNESLNILAAVILKTLIPKYENMLILEDMKSLDNDQAGGETIKKFFFGDISDRKKLLDKYIEQVKENNHLPEFQLLCHLASMDYEKRKNKTTLYFSSKEQKSGIRFESPELMLGAVEQLRPLRKIMEISGEGGAVYIKQPKMIISGVVAAKKFEGLAVEFQGNAEWILRKNRQEILIYRRGEYLIPVLAPKQEQELEKLNQLQGNMSDKELKNIKQIINRLIKNSPHGTSIVFMEREALQDEIRNRFLENRYTTKVEEFALGDNDNECNKCDKLDNNMLRGVTSIDGAILSDLSGKCLAIGTILDGTFVGPGNVGRGARYNSVRNYVNWYKTRHPDVVCFAVIISEDGMINVEIPTTIKS